MASTDLTNALAADGWVLPRGLRSGGDPEWTLVGTVASPIATAVDAAGLVSAEGWSLDWWVGGDDRWHLPAREAAVRQVLVDDAPVVETLVRIPGGDATSRTYGIRAPRPVGDEWVVTEITNRTPVPLALALIIRPFVADGVGEASEITVEPTGGGGGREVAHLVRVDGRPAVLLPRRPARFAAGSREVGDAARAVTEGDAVQDLIAAHCPDGLATLAMVFPLAHTATIRVAVPVGEGAGEAVAYPAPVPDAATVASGWDVHRRAPRFEIPEDRLQRAVRTAQAQIHLAHDGERVSRDGRSANHLEPEATGLLLGALGLLGRQDDIGVALARWVERGGEPTLDDDARFLAVASQHWTMVRGEALLQDLLPHVSASVERIGKADRKGRIANVAMRRRCVEGLAAAGAMLSLAGQDDGATQVLGLASRVGAGLGPIEAHAPLEHLRAAAGAFRAGDPSGLADLDRALDAASATGAWPGPGPVGRPVGHDLAATAALLVAARHLMVTERPDGLDLLPVHSDRWYGGGIELHDAPTGFGAISFAIRWHGTRPALLWELAAHDGIGPVVLRAPGLDPTWSSTEARGETLLAEVSPPEGLEETRVVSEHPDIDPDMRRPGSVSDAPAPPPPDGGSFS